MTNEEPKQWIVMRTDLKMRKGKMIAQGAHASMKVFFNCGWVKTKYPEVGTQVGPAARMQGKPLPRPQFTAALTRPMVEWMNGDYTKISVRVESEDELDVVFNKAEEAGLPCALITDLGKTEFNGVSTKTCCAIGPCYPSEVKDIVGHLKLL